MKRNVGIILSFSVILLISISSAVYFYLQWQRVKVNALSPTEVAKAEAKQLSASVSKFMDLPTGEEPTVARVTDATKISAQPFFAKAKNGDQVLIYTEAKLAILFDPVANRIKNVAPVNIGTASAQPVMKRKFVLYNGTSTVGLTKKMEALILDKVPDVEVTDRTNAQKRNYEKTILIPLVEKPDDAAIIAKDLDLTIAALPDGEKKPEDADYLIIIGSDIVK